MTDYHTYADSKDTPQTAWGLGTSFLPGNSAKTFTGLIRSQNKANREQRSKLIQV